MKRAIRATALCVAAGELVGLAGDVPIGLLLRTFWYGLVRLFTTL